MSSNYKFSTTELLHAIREIPKSLLNYTEKHLLTILLSCMNASNTSWHSIDVLTDYSCMSYRSVRRYIQSLAQKNFIFIDRPSLYTHHVTNTYHLNVELILSFHVVHKSKNVDKSEATQTPDVKVGGHTVQVGGHTVQSRGSDRPIKKDTKKEKKKESARKKTRLPLSPDFEPSKKTLSVAKEYGLTKDEALYEFEKFMAQFLDSGEVSGNWDFTLRKWLLRAAEFKKSGKVIGHSELPPEKVDPYKEEELKMKRFGGMAPVGSLVK